jgi:chaperonin GroES
MISSCNVTDENPAAQRQYPIGNRNVRPLNDRLIVRRLSDESNQSSHILVPEIAGKPSRRGVVVSTGPGKRHPDGHRIPLCVRPGDIVQFGRYTDFDDGDFLLIQEADVVGVVDADSEARGAPDGGTE